MRSGRLREHLLTGQEKQAIIEYHFDHPLNGYRRLTYMVLDANIVAFTVTLATSLRVTCWRVYRRRSMKRETESLRKPEKLDQKFVYHKLRQGMLNVLNRRIGQCWGAPPGRIITGPSQSRKQVQGAFKSSATPPAPATGLWPQCDKPRTFGSRATKTPKSYRFAQ